MYISIRGLLCFCGSILGIVVLVALVMCIFNLNKILKSILEILQENKRSISESIEGLPDTIQNVNDVLITTTATIENLGGVIEDVHNTVNDASVIIQERTQEAAAYSSIVGDVIKVIIDVVSRIGK